MTHNKMSGSIPGAARGAAPLNPILRKSHLPGICLMAASNATVPKSGGLWTILTTLALAGYGVVSFLPEYIGTTSTDITIPFRATVCIMSVIVAVPALLRGRRIGWSLSVFFVFMSLYGVRMCLDGLVYRVISPEDLHKQILFLAGGCVAPSVAIYLTNNCFRHRTLVSALFVVYAASSLMSILGLNVGNVLQSGRLYANLFYNPIDLGHVGVSLLLICVHRLLRARTFSYSLHVLLYGGGAALGAVTLFLAGSRGPVIACGACLIILSCAVWKWKLRGFGLRFVIVLLAVLGCSVVGLTVMDHYGAATLQRLAAIPNLSSQHEIRESLYQEAIFRMLDSPLSGASTVTSSGTYPHNVVLEAGMSLGIPGLATMLLFILAVCVRSMRLTFFANDTGVLGLLALQYVIASQFSGAIWSDDYLWVLSMLILATPTRRPRWVATRIASTVAGLIQPFQGGELVSHTEHGIR